MSVRVEFRWSEEFKARVDAAASFESRASFVRRAVEAAVEREESSLATIAMMRSREKPNTVAGVSDALKGVSLPEGPPLLAGLLADPEPVRRVSPSKPVAPRVPFRRDVKPFQRGDK